MRGSVADPGCLSRIRIRTLQKVAKKFIKNVNYFIFELVQKNMSVSWQKFNYFLPKRLLLSFQKIYGWIRNPDPGSRIPDPVLFTFRIPDPDLGVKKALDLGSEIRDKYLGSATLVLAFFHREFCTSTTFQARLTRLHSFLLHLKHIASTKCPYRKCSYRT